MRTGQTLQSEGRTTRTAMVVSSIRGTSFCALTSFSRGWLYRARIGLTMDATTASKQCAAALLSAANSCDVCCDCSVHAMDSVALCAAAAAASASALSAADSTSTCCGAY